MYYSNLGNKQSFSLLKYMKIFKMLHYFDYVYNYSVVEKLFVQVLEHCKYNLYFGLCPFEFAKNCYSSTIKKTLIINKN